MFEELSIEEANELLEMISNYLLTQEVFSYIRNINQFPC